MRQDVKTSRDLDRLLQEMNDSLDGRLEQDITLGDQYWLRRAAYQKALAIAGGVHVPENRQLTAEETRLKFNEEQSARLDPNGKLTPLEENIAENQGFGTTSSFQANTSEGRVRTAEEQLADLK